MSNPTLPPQDERVRGTMLLHDEDAALFKQIVRHLSASGTPPKVANIIRDALRCYAKQLNILT